MSGEDNIPGGTPAAGVVQPAPAAPPAAGGTPDPNREQWIPRQRFDEVHQENADLKARVAYYESQQTAAPQPQVSPAAPAQDEDAMPREYQSWEEWHAADPGSAIDWRTRQVTRKERQQTQVVEGRQKFLGEVYDEIPDLKDPIKRNSNPTYQAFTKLLSENPASAISYAGLKQVWELAKVRSGQSPDSVEAARQAGAQTEANRQAAANAGFAPVGAGSGYRPGGAGNTAPQLTPDQQKIASRYGMSPQEYLAKYGEKESPAGRITMKYEKARRG